MKRLLGPLVVGALALQACAHAPPSGVIPPGAEVSLTSAGDSSVGTYTSSWNGFRTSSYWIEGPTGLVIIDTQFLLSAAEQMIDWAEKATGKKAVLAIVLHPNPDKFNGTAVFQKRGIRVITSSQVLAEIPKVHRLRVSWFYDRFKPDYPLEEPRPESFGDSTREIDAAGLRLKLWVMPGPGCSRAHVVVQYQGHVFVGDLITKGFHSWLELGYLDEWMHRLDEIDWMKPEVVHTGRGGSGGPELIAHEKRYLQDVIDAVKRQHPRRGRELTPEVQKRIENEVFAKYPTYEYPLFVSNGLPSVWELMGGARAR